MAARLASAEAAGRSRTDRGREKTKKQIVQKMFLRYSIYALANFRRFMETTVDPLNRDEMEKRRLEAVQDLQRGLTQSSVARKFCVSRTTASRWNRALQQKGVDALRKRRATGRPSRLSREQLQIIPDIFAQGAIVHGFPDKRWTTARLAAVIEARFGVHYDHDHVGRLMQKLGLRQPRTRAVAVGAPAYSSFTPVRFSSTADLNRPSPLG
jgi:transposase